MSFPILCQTIQDRLVPDSWDSSYLNHEEINYKILIAELIKNFSHLHELNWYQHILQIQAEGARRNNQHKSNVTFLHCTWTVGSGCISSGRITSENFCSFTIFLFDLRKSKSQRYLGSSKIQKGLLQTQK